MVDAVEVAVIGAGVVGLAVARALAQRGREVLVLEAESTFGTQISARSSEVVHAGIYYPQGSLKAQLCVQGNRLLFDYCASRSVPHSRCGKLIVATNSQQMAQLRGVQAQAIANGVHDLRWLDGAQARALEPALQCVAALLSPSTGIVDSHALMLALLADIESAGGTVVFNSPLALAKFSNGAIELVAQDGTQLLTTCLVNAAGLQAVALASRFQGLDSRHVPTAHFAKGSYFSLSGRAPFRHLIYPLPEAAGLGVHLTLDLAGQARFGPDVQWTDDPLDTAVQPERGEVFYAAVRRYWPGLPDGALQPAYAGIRPKISGPGEPAQDFVIQGPKDHGVPGLVNLFGIESPGLTSALAIGEHVANLLL